MGLKYIIIIGGGKSQLPFITAAQNLGLGCVVLDQSPECPGASVGEHFQAVSTREGGALRQACLYFSNQLDVIGVMTYSAAAVSLRAVADITTLLSLRSFTVDSLAVTLHKPAMKKRLTASSVATARWISTANEKAGQAFLETLDTSIVIKPASDTQGSFGVSFVSTAAELSQAFQVAAQASPDGHVVLEEFIQGNEYSVDGIILNGRPFTFAASEKLNRGIDGNFVISGFRVMKNTALRARIERRAHEAVRALRLDNTLFSVDILDNGNISYVVECGVLLDCKIDRLLRYGGVDIYRTYVDLCVGRLSWNDLRRVDDGLELRFLFASRTGRLQTRALSSTRNVYVEWERQSGEIVRPPTSISDTIGWIIGNTHDVQAAQSSGHSLYEIL